LKVKGSLYASCVVCHQVKWLDMRSVCKDCYTTYDENAVAYKLFCNIRQGAFNSKEENDELDAMIDNWISRYENKFK